MSMETAMARAALFRHSAIMTTVAAFAIAVAISATALADEPWLTVLKGQLNKEKGCQLEHVVESRSVPIAGTVLREGRVRCVDGREYDFTQPSAHGKFEFKACQPAVC